MTWPAQTSNDFDPGDPAGSVSSVPFFQALYDRQGAIAYRGVFAHMAAVNTSSATYVEATNSERIRLRIPSWMTTGATIDLYGWVLVPTSQTVYLRLDEAGVPTTGTEQTYTTTGGVLGSFRFTLGADWSGTFKEFKLMMKTSSGTGTVYFEKNAASSYPQTGRLVLTSSTT